MMRCSVCLFRTCLGNALRRIVIYSVDSLNATQFVRSTTIFQYQCRALMGLTASTQKKKKRYVNPHFS